MKKLKVSKEELLQWYEDNDTGLTSKQVKAYNSDDWDNFFDDESSDDEIIMYGKYFEGSEPEPNYNDWIGEDCAFSDYQIGKHGEVYVGILSHITIDNYFIINYGRAYSHCMLKKDYVKLLKEQSK